MNKPVAKASDEHLPQSEFSEDVSSFDLILDVGANEGEFALSMALRNPNIKVMAFEPIPTLVSSILARAAAEGYDNLSCQQIAIDDVTRSAVFHIADHHDRGVSSLLNFNKNGIEANDYWRDRPDLYFSYDLNVHVSRLDEILASAPLGRIRFIKIDAQGVDLAVLRSLGTLLERVEAGMIEVPATRFSRLYNEENIDLGASLGFLHENGFDVHAIKPNDPAINEFNIMFHRRGLDWSAIEIDLGLRGLSLYDGRHFWHMPADHLMTPEADLIAAQGEGDRARAQSAANLQAAETALKEVAILHADIVDLKAEVTQVRQTAAEAIHGVELRDASLATAAHNTDALLEKNSDLCGQRDLLLLNTEKLRAQIVELRLQVSTHQAEHAEVLRRSDVTQNVLARAVEASAGAYRVAIAAEHEAGRVHAVRTHLLSINEALHVEARELRGMLASRQAEVDAACRNAEAAREEAEALREESHALQVEAGLLRERIMKLYQSSSWRLTGPLRRVVRLTRG